MPFWSGEKLQQRLPNIIVEDFCERNVDCSAYTLHIGTEFYTTPEKDAQTNGNKTIQQLCKDESFVIPAGQFGMLITREYVRIPNDAMAFISIKSTIKFMGLINVSGFHVDPGYYGKLVFSVFNAGPSPIHLREGMPLFLIWFADLDRPSRDEFTKAEARSGEPSRHQLDTPFVNSIRGEMYSLASLSKDIRDQEKLIDEIHKKADVSRALLIVLLTSVVTLTAAFFPALGGVEAWRAVFSENTDPAAENGAQSNDQTD